MYFFSINKSAIKSNNVHASRHHLTLDNRRTVALLLAHWVLVGRKGG